MYSKYYYIRIFSCMSFHHSLPRIYEEFNHTVANADYEKDLKWWSNNHGVNMPMNWPSFEVGGVGDGCNRMSTVIDLILSYVL